MYFITELDHRPDGIINASVTARQTFASGLSYYHERATKGAVSEQFTKVALTLADEELTELRHEVVPTAYVPAVEEVEEDVAE